MKNAKIWYLYNSSFALRLENKLLVFDYFSDQPANNEAGLEGGVITPEDLIGLDVYVFVSHSHHDHYNPTIYTWGNYANRVTYIFSDDVIAQPVNGLHLLKPHEVYNIHDLKVKTLLSNDLGLAFYIEIEGFFIFHSGDLNWWHWAEESKEWNAGMEKIFKKEMSALVGLPIDFAFLPVDPRLGDNYSLALRYFIDQVKTEQTQIFPMHFGDQFHVFEQLKRDGYLEEDYILPITHRGQVFDFNK